MPSKSLRPLLDLAAKHPYKLPICLHPHHGAAPNATVWKAA